MTDPSICRFLFHQTPPPEFGTDPFLLCTWSGGKAEVVSLDELSRTAAPIVTHSFSLLVEWFRNKSLSLPKTVIDLEIAKKLIVGRKGSDYGAEGPWDLSSMLDGLVDSKYDPPKVRAALRTFMSGPTSSGFGNLRWMVTVARNLPRLWKLTRDELMQSTELRRFEEIEIPTYNAMLDVQYRGIDIDTSARDVFLKAISEEYFSAHHKLTIREGVDVDRSFADMEYLRGFLKHPLRETEAMNDVRQVIKARKDSDPICCLLHSVASAQDNTRILFRSGVNEGCAFPLFDTMGTVTGRIIAVDPQLQQLSKKYRRIIRPHSGRKLLYLDYSQFEPNIMASISNDNSLLELCAEGDIYERLSFELNDGYDREAAKLALLAYLYGREAFDAATDMLIKKRARPLFEGIEKWKEGIAEQLFRDGRIGTLLGNHRYRTAHGDLSAQEKRWAVSQVVQGTGALILKKVISAVKQKLPEVFILLPMHDALLVEVPEFSALELTEELFNCFRETFLSVCPLASPSVKVKPFAEA